MRPVENKALTLIVPGSPDQRTGGYIYDARIVDGLRGLGWSVTVVGLEGRFPDADDAARQAMEAALSAIESGQQVVIDGLALGAVPEAVATHRERLILIGLVHHPLADETGLDPTEARRLLASERSALAHCRAVIVTSAFTRRRLAELGLVAGQPVHVVEPGVDAAPLAPRVQQRLAGASPEDSPRLLCVASLSPRKGQDLLLDALADLKHLRWSLRFVGSEARAPAFVRALDAKIADLDLEDRVRRLGEADTSGLEAAYRWADVCLLPSWYEGFGMVVTEALVRGLPLITTTGGALADTVPEAAALRVAPGRVDALREALEIWLTDPTERSRLTQAAADERLRLADWATASRQFSKALDSGLEASP